MKRAALRAPPPTSRPRLRCLLFIAAFLLTGARPPERLAVAVVQSRELEPYAEVMTGFQRGLEAGGYKPFVARYDLKGERQAVSGIIAELRRSPPDLILTLGTLATREVAREIPDVPIVFSMVLDPGASGLAPAGRTTGRNLTGVSMDIGPAQQLDAIKAILPAARRIGALYNPAETAPAVASAVEAARARGLTLIAEPVRSEREVPRAVGELSVKVDALLALPDATVYTESSTRYLLLHSLRQARPFIGLLEPFVRAGALAGLALDYRDLGAQAAELAIRVQKGDAPGQVAVQDPRKTRLLLNQRTARRIGVTFPAPVLTTAETFVP